MVAMLQHAVSECIRLHLVIGSYMLSYVKIKFQLVTMAVQHVAINYMNVTKCDKMTDNGL